MKTFRRYLSLALSLFILLFAVNPVFASGEIKSDILTPKDVEKLYEENMPEYLDEFLALTENEKMEFVNALKNPATWENIGKNNSIVKITTNRSSNELMQIYATVPIGRKMIGKASGVQNSLSLLGIPLLVYESDVEYKYTQGKSVTSIIRTNSYLKRALLPLYQTELLNTRTSTGTRGKVRFIHSYRVGPIKDLAVQLGTYNIEFDLSNKGTFKLNAWTE